MNAPRTLLIAAASVAVFFAACKKDEPTAVDLGFGYFPTRIGSWVEYQVDSMRVSRDNALWDTLMLSYAIREVLTENFTDLEGRSAQRMIRYVKDNTNTWIPKDVWWQTVDGIRAERSEENKRRVKLVFPPRPSMFWNTNARNTDPEFELTYDAIDEAWSANNLTFDSTVVVKGTYPSNAVNSKIYVERYAKNVGLVYHEVDSSETQLTNYHRYKVVYTATAHGQ
jgi:hypothetical protein